MVRHSQEFIPVRVLNTLPIDVLRKNGGLPSKVPFASVKINVISDSA